MKLMEFQRGLEDFDKCLSLDPNYEKAYPKKGNCHVVVKQYSKAMDAYNMGLSKAQEENVKLECQQGIAKISTQIYSGSTEDQEARAKEAMKDPEIQAILKNPQIMNVINQMGQNPHEMIKAMKDPVIKTAVDKLVLAGILKIG